MRKVFWLTDAQMMRPRPSFPNSHDSFPVDDLRMLGAIVLINRNGACCCRFCRVAPMPLCYISGEQDSTPLATVDALADAPVIRAVLRIVRRTAPVVEAGR